MHFAETLGMGGNTADFTDSTTAQLWATDRATANSGSWFVVSLGTHHFTGRNSYRTVVGGGTVVVEHDPSSGQARLSFNKEGGALEITAFGWADRQLLRLVDSVFVSDSKIEFHDPFFVTDHKPLLYTDPSTAFYGLPVAWLGYTTCRACVTGRELHHHRRRLPAFESRRGCPIRASPTHNRSTSATDPGSSARYGLRPTDVDRPVARRRPADHDARQPRCGEAAGDCRDGARGARRVGDAAGSTRSTRGLGAARRTSHVGSGWLDGPWIVQVSAASNDFHVVVRVVDRATSSQRDALASRGSAFLGAGHPSRRSSNTARPTCSPRCLVR